MLFENSPKLGDHQYAIESVNMKRSPSKYEEDKFEIGLPRGLRTISEEIAESPS
jgi:hypothetical protein